MNYLEVKITGSGDKWMVAQSLSEMAVVVSNTPIHKLEEGVEWQDGILKVKIHKVDDDTNK